jgi:hypothetical protein
MEINLLSPSGHIPLNRETLNRLSKEERAFWNDFLPRIMAAMKEAEETGEEKPYKLTPELENLFRVGITAYAGDQYCQIHQIRSIFDCPPAPPVSSAHVM